MHLQYTASEIWGSHRRATDGQNMLWNHQWFYVFNYFPVLYDSYFDIRDSCFLDVYYECAFLLLFFRCVFGYLRKQGFKITLGGNQFTKR